RRLLTRVADVMLRDDLPLLPPSATMRRAVVELARRRGIVVVVDGERRFLGVLTSGDLTRLMERENDFFDVEVRTIMTAAGQTARPDELASAVVFRMEQHGIISMPVLDDEGVVRGVIRLHGMTRAGGSCWTACLQRVPVRVFSGSPSRCLLPACWPPVPRPAALRSPSRTRWPIPPSRSCTVCVRLCSPWGSTRAR